MKNLIFLVCLFISMTLHGQEKSIITSEVSQDTYKNEYFDLSIKKPNGWYYQSPEDTMKMGQMGSRMLAGDDKQMEAIFKESLKSSVALFSFFEHQPGTPVNTNPNIVGVAENISLAPGVKTGCDYLFHARKLLMQSNMKFDIEEGCESQTWGSSPFGVMKVSTNMLGIDVFQNYNVCVKGEHAIVFIQTFFDATTKAVTDGVLSTLKMKCT